MLLQNSSNGQIKRLIMWSLRMSHHVVLIITNYFLLQQIISTSETWLEYFVTNVSAVQASISILKSSVFQNSVSFHKVLGHKEISYLDGYSMKLLSATNSNTLYSQIEKTSKGTCMSFYYWMAVLHEITRQATLSQLQKWWPEEEVENSFTIMP